jgi:ribosome biogenesis GTPase A
MGSMNSKSTNNVNILSPKNSNRLSSISRPRSLLSSCNYRNHDKDFRRFYSKRRLCSKKKVLILGLDGVGKTDLFNRLICSSKQESKTDSPPQPTIGKLVFVG